MKTKRSKIIPLIAVFLAIFVGTVIPKLTVRDAISLTPEEKSCVQAGVRQQFDHPLQRIALWFGKSAVIYKQGDEIIKPYTLVVKSYTIFRIPLPDTRMFDRFTYHVICDFGSEKTDDVFLEAVEFTEKIQAFVLKNFGQPIDSGFTAPMYLQAFPGLLEADFDGVETSEGKYEYSDGKLTFIRARTGYASTFEEAILEKGHKALFDSLRKRLSSSLSVDDIISRIQNDPTPPLVVSVGDILGAMTVVSAAPFNTGQYSSDPKMMQFGPQNAKVILRGPIEVTGTYSAVHSAIGFDGYCMSVSDPASLARLPVLPVHGVRPDISSYFFCFRNGETARQQLGEESQTITAKIDNLELNAYPAEVMTWTDLIDVVGK